MLKSIIRHLFLITHPEARVIFETMNEITNKEGMEIDRMRLGLFLLNGREKDKVLLARLNTEVGKISGLTNCKTADEEVILVKAFWEKIQEDYMNNYEKKHFDA